MTQPSAAQINASYAPFLAAATRQATTATAALPIPNPADLITAPAVAAAQLGQIASFAASPAGWGRVTKVGLGLALMIGGSIVLAYQTAFRPYHDTVHSFDRKVANQAALTN